MTRDEVIKIYDEVVAKCDRFERKGKTMPYTSANTHMFSQVNKEGQLGFRFSKETQQKYIKEWNADIYMSYGAVLKGYVLIPENMLGDVEKIVVYLNESFDYVMSLKAKSNS